MPQLPIESPKRNISREKKILGVEGKKHFVLKCTLAAISLSPTSVESGYQNLGKLTIHFSFKKILSYSELNIITL